MSERDINISLTDEPLDVAAIATHRLEKGIPPPSQNEAQIRLNEGLCGPCFWGLSL